MKRAYFGIAAGVIGLAMIAYGVLSGQAGLVLQKSNPYMSGVCGTWLKRNA